MTVSIDFSAVQLEALTSMHTLLGSDRWSLIGASAIRCRISLPRPTYDVDFAVLTIGDGLQRRLEQAGWVRDPKKLQTWGLGKARIDVVPVTDEDLLAGVADLGDGFELSVIGLDLAFAEVDLIEVREALVVPVPKLAVLLLLKMVAWLERGAARRKDLGDIVLIWDGALLPDDDRRWDSNHPILAAGLDYEDQGAFFCGWELGRIAGPGHLHWAKRFVDVMRDGNAVEFGQLVDSSNLLGDDTESRLRARLVAFERGLQAGMESESQPNAAPALPVEISRQRGLVWGASGSLQLILHDAIARRRIIRFQYQGMMRVAEPHVLGTKGSYLQVLTWQLDGESSSGPLPGWRLLFVDEIGDLEVTEISFAGQRLTRGRRHTAFDRQIVVVR